MSGAAPGAGEGTTKAPGHDETTRAESTGIPWPSSPDNPANDCRDAQAHAVASGIIRRLRPGTEFSADDVHRRMLPHVFCNPQRISAVLLELKRDGVIVGVGARRTARPSAHAGLQTLWRRVNPDPQVAQPEHLPLDRAGRGDDNPERSASIAGDTGRRRIAAERPKRSTGGDETGAAA